MLVATLLSCDSPSEPALADSDRAAGLSDDTRALAVLYDMGFPEESIVDHGSFFLVQGDVRFDKAGLVAHGSGRPQLPLVASQQRFLNSCGFLPLGNCGAVSSVGSIGIRVDGNVPAPYANATITAVAAWNSLPGTNVHLNYGASNGIRVKWSLIPDGACGRADYPLWGSVGGEITLTPSALSPLCLGREVNTMAHEIGHTLGFMHTNEYGGYQIPNTPTPGPHIEVNSVMRSSTHTWFGFTPYDRFSVRMIYPVSIPTPSLSNSAGKPRLTWPSVSGATSYKIRFSHKPCEWTGGGGTRGGPGTCENVTSEIGLTSATSFTDMARSYTGNATCVAHYQVEPRFSDGLWGRSGWIYNVGVC